MTDDTDAGIDVATDPKPETTYIPLIDTGHALIVTGTPDQLRAVTIGLAGMWGTHAEAVRQNVERICDHHDVDYDLIDAKHYDHDYDYLYDTDETDD